MSTTDRSALLTSFKKIDKDNSGDIDFQEFWGAVGDDVRKLGEQQVKVFFCTADSDENGKMDFEEYVKINKAIAQMKNLNQENISRALFMLTDTNNNGTLEKKEIARLMRSTGKPHDKKTIDRIFSVMDKNNDGHVTFDEFYAALSQ
ncbi:Troponin C, skeletal muscle, putative [Entamoeba invadens IP1]|uniref:Troponin C, skeletal muscle, putative n=1 Tax=Entamoeba invadens IP1 TaxID=370355 RepID=L7FMC0_ENTIV|nr:Troponin C, skeletal muscle, putative [Entamoeba invadens IP1]ELP88760.1 Troponin C, skeletal muscle, putative [Entamoeba invadens IP1]|eukprot:XP_004255531.1 Troponin C, skeletal muscle, putative [Entamoeba invadens IP1]